MLIRVCAFTTEGWNLVHKIEESMEDMLVEKKDEMQNLDSWVGECFQLGAAILFIGAISITVRKIAPFVNSKLSDSPVIAMDEKGQYIIPLLSNHVGGANKIAKQIADITGGQLVITTATDVNGAFAVDVFAMKNGLKIVNKDGIKKVSSKILEKGQISMAINPVIGFNIKDVPKSINIVDFNDKTADVIVDYPGSENAVKGLLTLVFKPYVLGIGCKKDTDYKKISSFISEILEENRIDERLISGIASIDLKSKERGILYYEAHKKIPFSTFTAHELEMVEGKFSESDFVKNITGVSNICERAAIKLAGDEAKLIVKKTAKDGMTLAIGIRKAMIQSWEM